MQPKVKTYHIDREDLDNMVIPPGSDLVLVKIPFWNKDERTESGLYVVGDNDYKPHDHTEKWGVVEKSCSDLYYDRMDPFGMQWKTEVEVERGDQVWFDYRKAANTANFMCEDETYKLLDYSSLYVAKRGDDIIPLNGYVLFREVMKNHSGLIEIEPTVDKRFGLVSFVGSYNQAYLADLYSDSIVLNPGDYVLFEENTHCFPLESGSHNRFSDEKYVLQQRKRVIAVVNDELTDVVRMHQKAIGVRVSDDKTEQGGVHLVKDHRHFRPGVVEKSIIPWLPEGSRVILPPKYGVSFNGLEYFFNDKVLYYEIPEVA